MVAFGHTAIGGIIGYYAYQTLIPGDPVSGLILTGTAGVISHYIMDCVPHGHFFKGSKGEYKANIMAVIIFDFALSVILYLAAAYFFSGNNILFTLFILFGIGGSQLPDILDGFIYTGFLPRKGLLKLENKFHGATHWHGREEKTLLLSIWDVWQVGFFFFGLYLLLTAKV